MVAVLMVSMLLKLNVLLLPKQTRPRHADKEKENEKNGSKDGSLLFPLVT